MTKSPFEEFLNQVEEIAAELESVPEIGWPPYEGNMKPGEFEVLVHGGTAGNPMVLEFLDVRPDMDFWLGEELDNLGPFTDDMGLGGDFEGLQIVHCRYVVHRHHGMDGPEEESEWVEISRRPVTWTDPAAPTPKPWRSRMFWYEATFFVALTAWLISWLY